MLTAEMQNFIERARAWLTLLSPADTSPKTFDWAGGRLIVADRVDCRPGTHIAEIVLVRGDFICGAGCRFDNPVFAGGSCQVDKATHLDRIATDGRLTLGPEVEVDNWAVAGEVLDLRAGARVAGAAISDLSIRLSMDASAGSLCAPEVATPDRVPEIADPGPSAGSLELTPPSAGSPPDLTILRGFRKEKLAPLGADTWVYDGSLSFPVPLVLRAKLVVRGSFWCPQGSLLEDDLKTGGSLRIGAGSLCRGNLISRSDIELEQDTLFAGDLRAGTALHLRRGVRGFRAGGPVTVSAGGNLILEPNVVVRGRLSSGTRVRVEQSEPEGGLDLLLAEGF